MNMSIQVHTQPLLETMEFKGDHPAQLVKITNFLFIFFCRKRFIRYGAIMSQNILRFSQPKTPENEVEIVGVDSKLCFFFSHC